jgi:hypothetical protein
VHWSEGAAGEGLPRPVKYKLAEVGVRVGVRRERRDAACHVKVNQGARCRSRQASVGLILWRWHVRGLA